MKARTKLIISLIALALVAGLCVALGFTAKNQQQYRITLDNIYKKSYYDVVDTVSDTELKLNKLNISEDTTAQKKLLFDVWLNSEETTDKLATLSTRNQNMDKIIRFVNQLGDYCYFLGQKINKNGLAASDRAKLDSLSTIVTNFKNALVTSSESVMEGANFVTELDKGIALLGDGYEHFNNDSTIEFPELIYDGPFSDGLSDRETKFLKNDKLVTAAEAQNIVQAAFKDDRKVALVSEVNSDIPSYLFKMTKTNGGEGFVEVTKQGGKLLSYVSYRELGMPTLTNDQCKAVADEKIKMMGYNDMEVVWVSNSHSTVYINFAYKANNIIYYPDLIKIKIAADNGELQGVECQNYIYNHTGSRAPSSVNYEMAEAKEKVSKNIKVETTRMVIIPTEWNTEVVAYEFYGKYKEESYFIYISADTLSEVEIKKVVEVDGGMSVA